MSESKKATPFSEAAITYAENLDIVTAMANRFTSEVDDFLDRVYAAILVSAGGRSLTEFSEQGAAGGYRVWWLDSPQLWKVPHLTIWNRRPQIVLTELAVGAYAQRNGPEKLNQFREAVADIELPPYCRWIDDRGSESGFICEVGFSYDMMDDPVGQPATGCLELLEVLMRSWREGSEGA